MAASPPATAAGTRARPWIDRQAGVPMVLFLLSLAIYLTTLTQVHTFDALSYVTSVERKPWTEVFHPHHLAYGPLGVLALHAGRALGYTGGAALPMQVVNALAGALGVALFYALVRRVTQRGDLALAGALLLGGGYAYWYYAVEIEVYTVATLFLIICLEILTRPSWWRSPRSLLLLGLAQAGAVLFHQTNVLLCGPIYVMFVASLIDDGRRTTDDGRLHRSSQTRTINRLSSIVYRLCPYGLTLALVVALPYLLVGVGVSGFRSWAAF